MTAPVCFVLAPGPGLTPEVILRVRRSYRKAVPRPRSIVVNDAYRLAPWAGLLYSSDAGWWRRERVALDFEGARCASSAACADLPIEWGIRVLPGDEGDGFRLDTKGIHFGGGQSGFAAVNLALLMGARRIVLCGFNLGPGLAGETHYAGCPEPVARTHDYPRWIAAIEKAAQDPALRERCIEILNATPGSHLTCFPIVTIDEACRRFEC